VEGEAGEGVVQKVGDIFTEEALAEQDGKTVPLTMGNGGPVIGEATMHYDEGEKALKAKFTVDDPKVAEFLKGPPPNIFEQ
jgi:hypothetical protein